MPKTSKRATALRRARRRASLATRQAQQTTQQAFKATAYLMLALAQRGGGLTFTKGTLEQLLPNLQHYRYDVAPNPADASEMVITLIDTRLTALGTTPVPDAAAAPDLTITKVDDDETDMPTLEDREASAAWDHQHQGSLNPIND